ncbi:MAG TPA: hypothetical protein VLU43_02575 [Anaeromyxobacteraceae bacterium]|nr:hypothetical protein [Anaeromyxobacteraceae bacterium]
MDDRIRRIEHKGRTILVADFAGIGADRYAEVLRRAAASIAREPPASVRLITYVKDARFGVGAAEHVKNYSSAIRPALKAGAVVGLSPLHRIIFIAVKPFLHSTVTAFDGIEAAKDWLATFE